MKNKKLLIVLFVVVVLLLAFVFYISGRGQIKITLPEAAVNQAMVSVYASKDRESPLFQTLESQSSTISIKPGSYFVLIENSSGSYASFVDVSSFMRTTKIEDFTLREQTGREFVAERPKNCFSETSLGVFSYTCLGPLSSLVLHEKATDSSPAKTVSTETDSVNRSRIVEAVHETEEGVYVLAYASERENFHDVYKLTKNQSSMYLSLVDSVNLGSQPLRQQYVSYSENNQVTLFSPTSMFGGNSLKTLQKLVSPSDFSPEATSLGQFSDGYWVVLEELSVSTDTPAIEYVARLVDKNISVDIEKPTNFSICADYLFILDVNNRLSVFNSGLKLEKSIGTVTGVMCVDNKPHIVLNNKLLVLSVENSVFDGYVALDSPTLTINSIEKYNNGVFMAANFADKGVLLKLNESAKKTDSLLGGLVSSQYVSSLSVGDSTVFVSLELGDWVADPETGDFDYDQNILTLADKEIRQIIAEIKLVNPNLVFIIPLLD